MTTNGLKDLSLVPVKLETGTYKRIKVKPFEESLEQGGLAGEKVELLLKEAEEKGFLTLPRYLTNDYLALKSTYLERCRKNNRIYVEVMIDHKWNRAFASFDAITLKRRWDSFEFEINDLVLNTELKSYYKKLTERDRSRICLPAELNPYRHSRNKTNYFILPKQISFGFYLTNPEIFYYALKKFR